MRNLLLLAFLASALDTENLAGAHLSAVSRLTSQTTLLGEVSLETLRSPTTHANVFGPPTHAVAPSALHSKSQSNLDFQASTQEATVIDKGSREGSREAPRDTTRTDSPIASTSTLLTHNATLPWSYKESNQSNEDRSLRNSSGFMSFEEWKKQKKLELEAKLADSEVSSASKPPQALIQPEKNSIHESASVKNDSLLVHEDQGRTYKDKFNYASVDCAATVVKTNSDAKGASAILTEVKDSYLINQCSTSNKFIVVELCQDVLISSIVMGNFELFSSMFRLVRFSVSDRFPALNGWQELGQFEAQNRRDVQSFLIENPLIWSRYLKIDILSHYGNEFYCPLSILRVHGTNMMEDFKNTESKAEKEVVPVPNEVLNYTVDFNEECKALSPYLAMNEFLKVFNSSREFCGVESNNITSTATATKATQESIFQNIIKRLSLLESNATLSLLYVEEQSKLLSDAFTSLEARQVKKFESLLVHFNDTIHSQVHFLEASLQRINEDSNIVLQSLKSFTSGAMRRIKAETQALVLELSFLKKLVVIDTLIILSLLVYVIFRESFVAEELLKKENVKKVPKKFPVSRRKAKPRNKRWSS